jgi:GH24 family phage-related lysozyme (muramidase)
MKHLKIFESWVNESLTADQIADKIQTSVVGSGTVEADLVSAIKAIPDAASMVRVNKALKTGFDTKSWDYASVGDAINGELGSFDQEYLDQINTHIKNIRADKYLGSFAAPPPPEDTVLKVIEPRVIQHEGYKPKKYIDSRGIPTVGVGFNLNRADSTSMLRSVGANPIKIKSGQSALTDQQIKALLQTDLQAAKTLAKTLVSDNGKVKIANVWPSLPQSIQGVLIEMVFNLGAKGLSEFNTFLLHISSRNFKAASKEMLNSTWAKQVGNRAITLSNIVKSA